MVTDDVVVRLNQELAGTKVLSVYLHAEENDPAERHAWRLRLAGMLKEVEDGLADVPSKERRAFQAAVEQIEEELAQYTGYLPKRGWVGFATPERLWHASPLPAPMPDLVRWEDGAHMAPYVRALKQARPVTVVVLDRRHARFCQYVHGELSEKEVLHSNSAIVDGQPEGSSKRAAGSSGQRGEARVDAARRSEDAATQRMLGDVVDRVEAAAKSGHLLVVGGSSEAVSSLMRSLSTAASDRTMEVSGISTDVSAAQLKEAVEEAASALSLRLQRNLVNEVIETTRSAGRACLGHEQTERALQAGAVDTLVFSRSFARNHPGAVEQLVDRTLEQGGSVEEISEAAATELDREGGIGARLRFTS